MMSAHKNTQTEKKKNTTKHTLTLRSCQDCCLIQCWNLCQTWMVDLIYDAKYNTTFMSKGEMPVKTATDIT